VGCPKKVTVLEWCAGYGGIHLGLSRAIRNLRVVAYAEIEAFACANLVAKMEAGFMDLAPVWTDIKTFPCAEFHNKVDIFTAGYPCQPFSAAGKRLGTEDPRHLWPFVIDAVRIIQPAYCFFENVEGHISLGLSTVISDLEEAGYRTTWGIFSAAEVGAPHRRKRVFIFAKLGDGADLRLCEPCTDTGETAADTNGEERRLHEPARAGSLPRHEPQPQGLENNTLIGRGARRAEPERFIGRAGADSAGIAVGLADCECEGLERRNSAELRECAGERPSWPCGTWPSRPGEQQYCWEPPRVVDNSGRNGVERSCGNAPKPVGDREDNGIFTQAGKYPNRQTEPPLGGDLDGPSDRLDHAELYESCDNRVDELRLLGNGVVPATAARAWEVLYAILNKMSRP